MERLADITVDDLQNALESVEEKNRHSACSLPLRAKRITQSEFAEWFDVERRTIYNWLTRLEELDIESTDGTSNR